MKLWYYCIMKILIYILFMFYFFITPAIAEEVLVLPTNILSEKENYYRFDEVSEIVANDVIKHFNKTDKINAPDLYKVKSKLNSNQQLKQISIRALENKKTDYEALKDIAKEFNCDYVLLISSAASTNKNSIKRSAWEILEISTAFDISYPYKHEISAILVDTNNSLVMWSNNYSTKLGNNLNKFQAKNYAQANDEYEKFKLYSQTIVSPSISQNIVLRFYPKSITPLRQETDESNGGALRFDKTIPEKPNLRPREEFYGDMIYGI